MPSSSQILGKPKKMSALLARILSKKPRAGGKAGAAKGDSDDLWSDRGRGRGGDEDGVGELGWPEDGLNDLDGKFIQAMKSVMNCMGDERAYLEIFFF
jgi:hypothetical protein